MASSTVLPWVFGACASICTALAPYVIYRDLKLSRHGVTAPGTVARMDEDSEGSPVAFVEFFADGARHEFPAFNVAGYVTGQPVRVRYLRQDPTEASIDHAGRVWTRTIVVVALGAAFWFVALVCSMLP